MEDNEAYTFANEVKSYLINKRYSVKGVNFSVRMLPLKGQAIQRLDEHKIMVAIGSIYL
jgi:hypothetical protein